MKYEMLNAYLSMVFILCLCGVCGCKVCGCKSLFWSWCCQYVDL